MDPKLPTIPEAIADLPTLQLFSSIAARGTLSGIHRSGLFGSSIDFAEHKPYSPGDELRHLDWKALARVDKLYLKRFEDETNVRIYLVLDASASMNFGSLAYRKIDYAVVLAATLSYLFLQQQDLVSLLRFGESETYIPPRGRMPHFQVLSETLIQTVPAGEGKLDAALADLRERVDHGGIICVLSDFLAGSTQISQLARTFESRRYETFWLHVMDPAEMDFPFHDPTRFVGLEGEELVDVNASEAALLYRKEIQSWTNELRQSALEHGIHYRTVRTSDPVQNLLASIVS